MVAPAAIASVKVLMTVSPAPVTSNTSWATVGNMRDPSAPLEQAHALLSAGDEHRVALQLLQKRAYLPS